MKYNIDHISVLVDFVERAAERFAAAGIEIGDKETFADVGTEEIYVGDGTMQALLLLQAASGDGPYKRALEKRGTGIHHIAICTDDYDAFNEKLSGLGWFVHPSSLRNYRKGQTVFYVRPGVKAMIELITKEEIAGGTDLISEVMVEVEEGKEQLINGIGLRGLKCSASIEPYIIIDSKTWNVSTL
jgi:hypothetical protein